MYLPGIISFIFFVSCAIYFAYGLYILTYNTKSLMHWLFFCCCLNMSLWALCFSIGNVAADYESALLWRRIASVGWGSMFSYLLHYILLLTESRLLRKKWIYVLLYVPALLNIFLYGIYTNTAVQSYHLVQTHFGWINIAGNTILDWYYDIYYMGFAAISIILLLRWGFFSKDIIKRRQAVLIGGSYIAAVIIGTLTEYIINYYLHEKVPQLAAIVILIPVSVMLFCVKRYNFMRREARSREPEANQILSEYTKSKLYSYLSFTYVIAGFVNFGVQFFSRREQVGNILLFSSIILGMGLTVGIIQNLKLKHKFRELFSNIVFIVSIPVMILKYMSVSGIYAMAVPVILMLVAVAFNQRQMLFFIGAASFATLIWLWVKAPVSNVIFSSADHISRIIILTIILWFVFYINRTYVEIINVNKEKAELERLINRVSNIFIYTTESNIDEKINESIELCGNYFKLELLHFSFLSQEKMPYKDYEWYASGTETKDRTCTTERLRELISVIDPDKLAAEGSLFVSDPNTPKEYKQIGNLLEGIGVKSLVVKPLKDKNRTIGFLYLGSIINLAWTEQQQQTADLIARLVTEIWAKLEAERVLYYQANYDILTGLPNKITFFKQLSQEIYKAKQTGKLLGVIFTDIDTFKSVNDSVGHDSGDSILIQIGSILRECISPADFLARFGGDEFLIMVPQIDSVDAIRRVAERLTDSFKRSFTIKGREFHISASTGIAVYPNDGTDPETLIKNADLAMYKSKEQGKNRYTFCTEEMKLEVLRNIRLAEDLHRALERHELRLHYQPQVCALSKRIIGVEALLRWYHPEFGIILPGLFIPLAEQTGLIDSIGDWVLVTACLQCRTYHLKGLPDIRVAVNVSIIQIRNPGFASRVRQILEQTQLEPHYLELEITESIAVRESDYFIEMLNSLKEIGVSIAIDDFGTEYSSLSRLCAMPIDRIKLDMQFTRGIGRSEKEGLIIRGIIDLAHTLGLEVIAEGVESEKQLDFLTKSRINEIQGFYYYKPLPPEDLMQVLLQEIPTNCLLETSSFPEALNG